MNGFRDLILALDKFQVRYLIIGGYAVGPHHDPRTTKDLDIFVATSPGDSRRVFAALQDFRAPLSGIGPEFFATRRKQWFQMGHPPFRIDILQSIEGKEFEVAWSTKIEGTLFGVPVFVISRKDLIDNKLATGRPVDRRDARNLKEH